MWRALVRIVSLTDVEIRDTNHLYLLQSKMSEILREWVNASKGWPPLASSIALKWLDEGLRDRSITRDLSWGIPVVDKNGQTRDGFEGKVFYVWFDAPIAYIGATQDWAAETSSDWERWWRTDKGADDVQYVQFMGKDNVAFHTLSFPTTLKGSEEPWKLVDQLKAFNWVTWYGGKFSTSQNRGVFMDQASDIAPGDYWRWYLTSNSPESSDAAFTWEDFQASINSDLANVLGNFVNRITKYCVGKFDGKVPEGGEAGEAEAWLIEELNVRLPALVKFYEQGLNMVALCGVIAQPVIPETAAKILNAMNIPEEYRTWNFGEKATYWILFTVLASVLFTIIDTFLFSNLAATGIEPTGLIFSLVTFVPGLSS